jgi:hypothetical protein
LRYFLTIFIVLIAIVLFLQSRLKQTNLELPVFLQVDTIVNNHQTNIKTIIQHSYYKPDSTQLINFNKDYVAIWAHLNNLYSTGDVTKGKEYYTQDWFNLICKEYKLPTKTSIKRLDVSHNLHIINWSFDGLVCNVIDSNVLIKTYHKNTLLDSANQTFAFALLFQGDHWRIDGFKQLQ